MGTRPEFQTLLSDLDDGVTAYFDPPSSLAMSFPAIVYNIDLMYIGHADDSAYSKKNRYQVMLVTSDPDDPIMDLIANLPFTRFVRHFTTANKHHYIFATYF